MQLLTSCLFVYFLWLTDGLLLYGKYFWLLWFRMNRDRFSLLLLVRLRDLSLLNFHELSYFIRYLAAFSRFFNLFWLHSLLHYPLFSSFEARRFDILFFCFFSFFSSHLSIPFSLFLFSLAFNYILRPRLALALSSAFYRLCGNLSWLLRHLLQSFNFLSLLNCRFLGLLFFG